jgi:hypothetical protein
VEPDKAQGNEVFEALEASHLDPNDFEWGTTVISQDGHRTATLGHRHSDASFVFPYKEFPPLSLRLLNLISTSRSAPTARYVGRWTLSDGRRHWYIADGWEDTSTAFRTWAARLEKDLDEPDRWELLASARNASANAPFSPEELREIARQLAAIAASAQAKYGLSDAELRALKGRLRYLEEKSARFGRLDWQNLLVGVIMTLFAEALMPPEATRGILHELIQALSHLYSQRILPELPPGY